MLWRFTHDAVEDTDIGMLHRPTCGEIGHAHALDQHPAGSSVRREFALRECWACRPQIELVLGVTGNPELHYLASAWSQLPEARLERLLVSAQYPREGPRARAFSPRQLRLLDRDELARLAHEDLAVRDLRRIRERSLELLLAHPVGGDVC